jgi:hypothetical protein
MLITLNNQKTVDIPFEQYDSMSDWEWKIFMDSEYGEQINNPFYNSQIDTKPTESFSSDDDLMDYDE